MTRTQEESDLDLQATQTCFFLSYRECSHRECVLEKGP